VVLSEDGSDVRLWDLSAGTNTAIAEVAAGQSIGPVISSDGHRVAFVSERQLVNDIPVSGGPHLYVYDFPTATFRLANVNLDHSSSSNLTTTFLSFDPTGDLLAFDSPEGNLVPGDNNQAPDVFVYSWSSDSVSVTSGQASGLNNKTGQGMSFSGPFSVSANGRYVAFSTTDTNLYPSPNSWTNAYNLAVWDTWLKTNVLSSILTNVPTQDGGTGAPVTNYLNTTASGAGPVLSLDGSTVAFVAMTPALQLAWNSNVFALNLQTAGSTWVNKSPSAINGAFSGQFSLNPSFSADARYIAYQTDIGDIPSNVPDTGFASDVFVYDFSLRTNVTVSVNMNGTATANGPSFNPLISSDGRWVLFQSTANNLTTNPYPASSTQEYIRDLVTSNTVLVSMGFDGQPLSGTAKTHVFSLNGRVAAFSGVFGFGQAGVNLAIFVYDPYANTNRMICTNCQNPSLDATGRWLAYESLPTGGFSGQIELIDLQTGQLTDISVNNAGHFGNTNSTAPVISSDARYIAFTSKASDLVPNDNNGLSDVFVRDRVLGKTILLSMNSQGTGSANGASARPAFSADGRTVVFQSLATDLSPGDYNQFRDVFVTRIGGQDSDGDGMDDDWEVAYFGNLSRNGSGDFDGDGQSDLQEFRAGTDPTNQGSVLRAITVSGAGSSSVNVLWTSVPGKTYRVQYKDVVSVSGWNDLPGLVTATSTTAAKQDTQPGPQRFYRIVLVE